MSLTEKLYERAKTPARTAFTAAALTAKYPEKIGNLSCSQNTLGNYFYDGLSPLEKTAISADNGLNYLKVSETAQNLGNFGVGIAAGLWTATALRWGREKACKAYNITSERAKDAIDALSYGATAIGTTIATNLSKTLSGDLIAKTLEGVTTSIPDTIKGLAGAAIEESIFANAFVSTLALKAAYKLGKSILYNYKKK
jgi:hypothetical protein